MYSSLVHARTPANTCESSEQPLPLASDEFVPDLLQCGSKFRDRWWFFWRTLLRYVSLMVGAARLFTEIGQSAASLWPKTIFKNGGRPPS